MPDEFMPWKYSRYRVGAPRPNLSTGHRKRPPMTNPDTMANAKARCHLVTDNTGTRRCGRCKILIDHDDNADFSCPKGLDSHARGVL